MELIDRLILLEAEKVFERQERFKKKIFVTKIGPVFNFKKKNLLDDKFKKLDNLKIRVQERKVDKTEFELSKNESSSNIFRNTDGFSIGIKPNKDLNLKKKRKEELLLRNQEINNLFDFQNITTYNKPFLDVKKESNNQRSQTEESIRRNIKKKREESINIKKIKSQKKFEAIQKK